MKDIKKRYKYSISSNGMWGTFDNGEVEANTISEAYDLARNQLEIDFRIVNKILSQFNETDSFKINFDENQIQIEEVKENNFDYQDMSGENTEDALKWLEDNEMDALIDESMGGIIGYINKVHMERILTILNKKH